MKVLAGALLVMCGGLLSAGAQEGVLCTPGVVSVPAALDAAGRGGTFSAVVKTSFEQRLVDGNMIAGTSRTHVYQNAEGWIRTEIVASCFRDADGKLNPQLQVTVYKPKTAETVRWTEGLYASKEATLMRFVQPTAEERAAQQGRVKAASALRRLPMQPRPEPLGSITIAGLDALGTRRTYTSAPGDAGNSMPLVTVNEIWETKDGLIVRSVTDDPRRGKTVSEAEEFVKGEPDPSVFAPPLGYTLKENTPQIMVPVKTP